MTNQPLSPAVNAVWEAFSEDEAAVFVNYGDRLAAALHALAYHQRPTWDGTGSACHWNPTPHTRRELCNIAAKLEGANA